MLELVVIALLRINLHLMNPVSDFYNPYSFLIYIFISELNNSPPCNSSDNLIQNLIL